MYGGKIGENTDLECDLILCRNMESKKGGRHKIGSFWNVDWRRMEKIRWTKHISYEEVLKLIFYSILFTYLYTAPLAAKTNQRRPPVR